MDHHSPGVEGWLGWPGLAHQFTVPQFIPAGCLTDRGSYVFPVLSWCSTVIQWTFFQFRLVGAEPGQPFCFVALWLCEKHGEKKTRRRKQHRINMETIQKMEWRCWAYLFTYYFCFFTYYILFSSQNKSTAWQTRRSRFKICHNVKANIRVPFFLGHEAPFYLTHDAVHII